MGEAVVLVRGGGFENPDPGLEAVEAYADEPGEQQSKGMCP